MMQMKKALNRLDGFHIPGRGTTPGGGVPLAVSSGRHVVLVIRKQDRKRFVATEPWCTTCRGEGNPALGMGVSPDLDRRRRLRFTKRFAIPRKGRKCRAKDSSLRN